jgi:hypothetical protein
MADHFPGVQVALEFVGGQHVAEALKAVQADVGEREQRARQILLIDGQVEFGFPARVLANQAAYTGVHEAHFLRSAYAAAFGAQAAGAHDVDHHLCRLDDAARGIGSEARGECEHLHAFAAGVAKGQRVTVQDGDHGRAVSPENALTGGDLGGVGPVGQAASGGEVVDYGGGQRAGRQAVIFHQRPHQAVDGVHLPGAKEGSDHGVGNRILGLTHGVQLRIVPAGCIHSSGHCIGSGVPEAGDKSGRAASEASSPASAVPSPYGRTLDAGSLRP